MEDADILVVCLALVALCVQTALALHMGVIPRGMAVVHSLHKKLRSLLVESAKEKRPDDAVCQEVARIMVKRQVSMFKVLLPGCSGWCFAVLCQLLFHNFNNQPEWIPLKADFTFFVFYLTIMLLIYAPSLITPRTLNLWCSFLMLVNVVFMSPLVFDRGMSILATITTSALRCWCGFCMKQSVHIFWTVIWVCVLGLHFLGQQDCECASNVFDGIKVLSSEATAGFGFVLIRWQFHVIMEKEARTQVESRAARTGMRASKALLATLCDAVLELDADMRLKELSPSFGTLLLQPANHPPVGTKLHKFMHSDDDREQLENNMQQSSHENDAIADAFHLKMNDSNGSPVSVELFHICFNDSLTERPEHLVGIREHSDMGERLPVQLMGETQMKMEVRFDAVSFHVLSCSAQFHSVFGHTAPGTSVDDWWSSAEDQLQEFCSMVNNFFFSHDSICFFNIEPLALQLPSSGRCPKLSSCVSFELTRSDPSPGLAPDPGRTHTVVARMMLSPSRGAGSETSSSSWTKNSQGRGRRRLPPTRGTPAVTGPRQEIQALEEKATVSSGCLLSDEDLRRGGAMEETTVSI